MSPLRRLIITQLMNNFPLSAPKTTLSILNEAISQAIVSTKEAKIKIIPKNIIKVELTKGARKAVTANIIEPIRLIVQSLPTTDKH